ncbi:MAG: UDP-N-acetylglucosamine 2-epimerase (non-hydrolyzing) [Azospirillum sp.]|nr:UDP-N-acetylglucosamine 2-epimerase (non-hydrolyzing) [Azospirillum sp.]
MGRHAVFCVIGTRPEAIKMAPVVSALRATPWADVVILATGQHRDLLDQAFAAFDLTAPIDLDVMAPGQTLSQLTARLFVALEAVLAERRPALVLAQGDTTTVFVASVVCFYLGIPFGHVEAGLRTGNLVYPFPEEFNRRATALTAALHFAPTGRAREHLLSEGVADSAVLVTGNTAIDAVLDMAARAPAFPSDRQQGRPLILVTAHRRENFGAPMLRIFDALLQLLDRNPDLEMIYPVHPNPEVRPLAHRLLGGRPRLTLCEPLGYRDFIGAVKSAHLVLSDSGGVQEEAPALGRPVLVLREETERPEAVEAGGVRLVGTEPARIIAEVERLLHDPAHYRAMATPRFPYGDGNAAARIVGAIEAFLGTAPPRGR